MELFISLTPSGSGGSLIFVPLLAMGHVPAHSQSLLADWAGYYRVALLSSVAKLRLLHQSTDFVVPSLMHSVGHSLSNCHALRQREIMILSNDHQFLIIELKQQRPEVKMIEVLSYNFSIF